jgi:DNA-binding transcriptional LysR family regulator
MAAEPHGSLRVTGPSRISNTAGAMFSGFLARYPRIGLQLLEDDRVVDLIGEGLDAALRGTAAPEPGLLSVRLLTLSFRLFASPAYLASRDPIARLSDLGAGLCVLSSAAQAETWTLRREGLAASVKVSGRFRSRNLNARHNGALWGMGVALLPELVCGPQVAAGLLAPVLPEYDGDGGSLWLVYPEARHPSPALRAFISYVTEYPWGHGMFTEACPLAAPVGAGEERTRDPSGPLRLRYPGPG